MPQKRHPKGSPSGKGGQFARNERPRDKADGPLTLSKNITFDIKGEHVHLTHTNGKWESVDVVGHAKFAALLEAANTSSTAELNKTVKLWLATDLTKELLNEERLNWHQALISVYLFEKLALSEHAGLFQNYDATKALKAVDFSADVQQRAHERITPAKYVALVSLFMIEASQEQMRLYENKPCKYLPHWVDGSGSLADTLVREAFYSNLPSVDGMKRIVKNLVGALVKETESKRSLLEAHSITAVAETTGVGETLGDKTLLAEVFNAAYRYNLSYRKNLSNNGGRSRPSVQGVFAQDWSSPLLLLSQYMLCGKDDKEMAAWCKEVSPQGFPGLDRYRLRQLALSDGPDQKEAASIYRILDGEAISP